MSGEKSKSASQTDGKAAQNKTSEMGMMSYKVQYTHTHTHTHTLHPTCPPDGQTSANIEFVTLCEAAGLTHTLPSWRMSIITTWWFELSDSYNWQKKKCEASVCKVSWWGGSCRNHTVISFNSIFGNFVSSATGHSNIFLPSSFVVVWFWNHLCDLLSHSTLLFLYPDVCVWPWELPGPLYWDQRRVHECVWHGNG